MFSSNETSQPDGSQPMLKKPRTVILLLMLGESAVLFVLSIAFAWEWISPRAFAILVMITLPLLFVGLVMLFKKAQKLGALRASVTGQGGENRKNSLPIWISIFIIYLVCSLVRGLFVTSGAPVWQRVIPSLISLFLISTLAISLRRIMKSKR